MPTSAKKVESNRCNSQKSSGPTNTTSTRFNAVKHGLLAEGITELDDADAYRQIQRDLIREKDPAEGIEKFLVEAAALDMVRWVRARRLEAQYITGVLNPPQREKSLLDELDFEIQGEVLNPGLPAAITVGHAQYLVGVFQRYESFFSNRLFRIFHELERLQQMRHGYHLPAPAAVDVSVHVDTGTLDAAPTAPEQPETVPISNGESWTGTCHG
jgi:hypothetical protein